MNQGAGTAWTIAVEAAGAGAQGAAFPADAYWRDELGVDLAAVERALSDREGLVRWLARQSEALIAMLEAAAGQASGRMSKRERCERLLQSGQGILAARQALIAREYLTSRRRDALSEAVRSIAWHDSGVDGLENMAQDPLCAVLAVARSSPRYLPWFWLWDQAVRVGYRERRLNATQPGARKIPERGDAWTGAVGRELVEEAVGAAGLSGELRTVDVVPIGGGEGLLIFLLQEEKERARARAVPAVQPKERARWIILRAEDGWRRLLVHSQSELGVRLAERIAARALGLEAVSYTPYRPESDADRVWAWAARVIESPPEEVRLYDLEVVVDTEPGVVWRIYGEVKRGLERLARGGRGGSRELAAGVVRLNLGFRAGPSEPWSRFTVSVRPGASATTRIVTFRGQGATRGNERAFRQWMHEHDVTAAVE